MSDRAETILAGVLILFCMRVSADSTADRLTRIEEETLVLKAQEKQLGVQAQIAGRQAEIALKQAAAHQASRRNTSGKPVVFAIEGIGKTLFATLLFENGSLLEVKEGDVLPNRMKIVSVHMGEVIVETETQRKVALELASFQPRIASGGGLAHPSLPPLPLPLPAAGVPAKGAAR